MNTIKDLYRFCPVAFQKSQNLYPMKSRRAYADTSNCPRVLPVLRGGGLTLQATRCLSLGVSRGRMPASQPLAAHSNAEGGIGLNVLGVSFNAEVLGKVK